MILALRAELLTLTAGRPDFSKFTDADVADKADLFFANGIATASDINNIRPEGSDVLAEDLRGDGYRVIEIQLFMDIPHIRPPLLGVKRLSIRNMRMRTSPKRCGAGKLTSAA